MRYKLLIRKYIVRAKSKNPKLRNCHLAQRLGIEPSYLSRFFTDREAHFSDELIFLLLTQLELSASQIDHILTLKEFERCQLPLRKKYLEEKLSVLKLQKLRVEFERIKISLQETIELLSSHEKESAARDGKSL